MRERERLSFVARNEVFPWSCNADTFSGRESHSWGAHGVDWRGFNAIHCLIKFSATSSSVHVMQIAHRANWWHFPSAGAV